MQYPAYEVSQGYLAYPTMADTLFGPEAYHSASQRILKPPVRQYLYEVTLSYWHHQDRKFRNEWARLDGLKKTVADGWCHGSYRRRCGVSETQKRR